MSKITDIAKGALKNKAQGKDVKDQAKDAAKQLAKEAIKQVAKKALIAALPYLAIALAVILLVGCVALIIDGLTGASSNSIKVTTDKYQQQIDAGEFQGDPNQIQRALGFMNTFGSNIGFTRDQVSDIYNQTIKDLGSNEDAVNTFNSKYGWMTSQRKNDAFFDTYVKMVMEDSGDPKPDLNETETALYEYYKYTKEGTFKGMVTPFDNRSIYEHCLNMEKYNFNGIKWMKYTHDEDAKELEKDDFALDSNLGVIYPKAGDEDLYDFINLLAPYMTSSYIPLCYLTSAIYSHNQTTTTGNSVYDDYKREEQGKLNDVGDFAYQVVKYGQSDIVMNQYNLANLTITSEYKDYDVYKCKDSFTITVTTVYETLADGTSIPHTTYSVGSYVDGTSDSSLESNNNKKHINEKWDEGTENLRNANEKIISKVPGLVIKYKLSSALAFDVKINNSYNYEKYSDDDAAILENPTIPATETPTEYKKVNSGKHYTQEEVSALSPAQLASLVSGLQGIAIDPTKTKYIYTSPEYEYHNGYSYEVTRFYSDTVSNEPTSTTKKLLDTTDIISFNSNTEKDPAKETVSSEEFKADKTSVDYYNEQLITPEDRAINKVHILNSNPKIYKKYISATQAYSKYVGYDIGDYALAKGNSQITSEFKQMADDNGGKLPFVYGASFGFETDATSASTLGASRGGGMSLLKEFIHAWEYVGTPPTQDGKYVVYDDGFGHPTVGYGVDIFNCGHASDFTSQGYDTSVGALVDIDFVDGIEDQIIATKASIVEANTQGLNLTEYQTHALICKAYNYWKSNFRDCYIAYWNQERDDRLYGEPDYSHQLYVQSMSLPITAAGKVAQGLIYRRESEFNLFQTGHYFREGVIDKWWSQAASGNIMEAAEIVHSQYESEQWIYYTKGGTLYWNNIEKSVNNSTHATCCATFVGASLYVAGIFTEDQMNSFNYNYCPTSFDFYSQYGDVINAYDDLEAGDIVFFDYEHDGKLDHVELYAGDNTWYGAGSTKTIQAASPRNDGNYWRAPFAKAVRLRLDTP